MLKEFAVDLKKIISEKLGDHFDIRITHVVKNNGVDLEGMVILRKGENVAPTIYVNHYYSQYCIGRQMESIILEIITQYKNTAIPQADWSGEEIVSFRNMQEKIIFRLVNYEKNRKELDKIPHMLFLDLAVTFYCFIHKTPDGIGTVRVTWEILDKWGVDLDILWRKAKENTPKLFPSQILPMEDVIKAIHNHDAIMSEETQFLPKIPMFVLTNQSGINGATVLLYENALKMIADTHQTDFYILPSSIHEVILVPYQEEYIKEKLCEIVCNVNDTEVSREEILSDKVYIYKRKSGIFEIISK